MSEPSKLAKDWWVVVRMDNHYNEVIVPLDSGSISVAKARQRAALISYMHKRIRQTMSINNPSLPRNMIQKVM